MSELEALIERLADDLRDELAEMAVRCTVPMDLWDSFSNHVLEAATTIRTLTSQLEEVRKEREWLPIETAPFTFDASFSPPTRWLDWCLLGHFDRHGWVEWVGGMDADEWLIRDDDRCCAATVTPTHWQPLPDAPVTV